MPSALWGRVRIHGEIWLVADCSSTKHRSTPALCQESASAVSSSALMGFTDAPSASVYKYTRPPHGLVAAWGPWRLRSDLLLCADGDMTALHDPVETLVGKTTSQYRDQILGPHPHNGCTWNEIWACPHGGSSLEAWEEKEAYGQMVPGSNHKLARKNLSGEVKAWCNGTVVVVCPCVQN